MWTSDMILFKTIFTAINLAGLVFIYWLAGFEGAILIGLSWIMADLDWMRFRKSVE
jgi:hypothetical protein